MRADQAFFLTQAEIFLKFSRFFRERQYAWLHDWSGHSCGWAGIIWLRRSFPKTLSNTKFEMLKE